MRITFVLPHAGLSGGVRVVALHAQGLMDRGHDVHVVSTPWYGAARWGRLRWGLERVGLARPWRSPGHFDGLAVAHHVLERDRPVRDADVPDADVVVATWWATAEGVMGLAPAKGAKAYFLQADERDWCQPGVHDHLRAAVEATWKFKMHRIAVGSWLGEELALTGVRERVGIVPNAVSFEQFHADPRGKQATPTIGMLYVPVHFKGSDIGLSAFRIARERVPTLRLLCLTEAAPTISLPDGAVAVVRPPQEQLRSIYAGCDAWLFCSRREGFGLPILEAMACRTPVIATPTGAAPDVIPMGGGVLVPHEDPGSMAEEIVRLVTMPEDVWRPLSDAAFRNARSYSWADATALMERELGLAVKAAQPASVPADVRS